MSHIVLFSIVDFIILVVESNVLLLNAVYLKK